MASSSVLLAFAITTVVFVALPGPSVLFTISRALTVGRRDALVTVWGNATGVYAQVVAAAFGVGAVVERSAQALAVIKLVGAAYLIYLGIRAVRRRRDLAEAFQAQVTPKPAGRVLLDGFVVGLTNPKSIVFFTVALPQFVSRSNGQVPAQMLILGALFPVVALVSDTGWALAASTARAWFARSPRRLELVGGAGGLVMIGLGASLAVTGRKD
ncbi:MAG TPA: LysE family translocator [Pseudonocardiaceae bacterium]|nr:LysE family translocator [Pseudonocardiaceae bacterium]